MRRNTFQMIAAVAIVAVMAGIASAQVRVRPIAPGNPSRIPAAYPYPIPYPVLAQAAAVNANITAIHNAFVANTYAMANPYYSYYHNPYAWSGYVNPYFHGYPVSPYANPYYGAGYSAQAYSNPYYGYPPMYGNPPAQNPAPAMNLVPPFKPNDAKPQQPSSLSAFNIPTDNGNVRWPFVFRMMPPDRKRELLDPLEAQLRIVTSQAISGNANPALVQDATNKVESLHQWLRSRRLDFAGGAVSEGNNFLHQLDAALQRMRGEN